MKLFVRIVLLSASTARPLSFSWVVKHSYDEGVERDVFNCIVLLQCRVIRGVEIVLETATEKKEQLKRTN